MSLLRKAKLASRALFDPRYRYLYRQRSIVDPERRERMAAKVIAGLPAVEPCETEAGRTLAEDGIVFLDGLISPEQVNAMSVYFTGAPARDPYRPKYGEFSAPECAPAKSHVAFIRDDWVVSAPGAIELANHPVVLNAVSQFLGAKPTISYMAAWWSLPAMDGPEGPENYHRDWDDYRFVKLFLYLTDVDLDSGPHGFVRGSHKSLRLTQRRRYSEEEVEEAFSDPADRMIITGSKGTHFLETTAGVHRGFPPKRKKRLIFQVLYSLTPYIGGPRAPVYRLPPHRRSGLDPYTNRIYCSFD